MRAFPASAALLAVVCLALPLAACGDDATPSGDRAGTTTTPPGRGEPGDPPPGARTGAADLRAALTGLLVTHVHLTAFALDVALAEGLDGEGFPAATRAVDDNASALADLLGGVGGAGAAGSRDAVLGLIRVQTGALVDVAKARAAEDDDARAGAQTRLDDARTDLVALLGRLAGADAEGDIGQAFRPVLIGLLDVVEAQSRRSEGAYEAQRRAAVKVPPVAERVARGIAGSRRARFDGSATSGAADLRARLTAVLTDHVHLTLASVTASVAAGPGSPFAEAAAAATDRTSTELAEVILDVYGAQAGRGLLELWRAHIDMFQAYGAAQRSGDRPGARAALADLDRWRTDLGTFVARLNPQLPAGAVTQELTPHVESMTAAIRAAVKGSPRTFDRLREAAGEIAGTATLLADGIAQQEPGRFPAG